MILDSGQGLPHPEADYWSRLDFEIEIISKMGFAGYFQIV